MQAQDSPTTLIAGRSHELEALPIAERVRAAWLAGFSSPATRAAYGRDVDRWLAALARDGVEPFEALRVHAELYARRLERDGLAPASVARMLASVASFYRYAEDEEVIAKNPLARVKRPKPGEPNTQGLDRAELAALLSAAETPRDRALVTLLSLVGLRVSEALAADVSDLGHERGYRTLSITRKGARRGRVPLSPRVAEAIDAYLAGREDGPLFVTSTGRRLTARAAARTVASLAKRAGIDKKISPHSLRHSFATLSLDAGASLRDLQAAMGHADPKTTMGYDRSRERLDAHPVHLLSGLI